MSDDASLDDCVRSSARLTDTQLRCSKCSERLLLLRRDACAVASLFGLLTFAASQCIMYMSLCFLVSADCLSLLIFRDQNERHTKAQRHNEDPTAEFFTLLTNAELFCESFSSSTENSPLSDSLLSNSHQVSSKSANESSTSGKHT